MQLHDEFRFTDAYNRRYGYPRKAVYRVRSIAEDGIGCVAIDTAESYGNRFSKAVTYCFPAGPDIEHVNEAPYCVWTKLDGVEQAVVVDVPAPEPKKLLAPEPAVDEGSKLSQCEIVTLDDAGNEIDRFTPTIDELLEFAGVSPDGVVELSDEDIEEMKMAATLAGDETMLRTLAVAETLEPGEAIPYDAGSKVDSIVAALLFDMEGE